MFYFDWIILGCVLVSGVFSYYRGVIKEVSSVTKWFVAAFLALKYYYVFQKYTLPLAWNDIFISNLISGGAVFVITLIAFTVFFHIFSISLNSALIKKLDQTLGFVFGIIKMILFLGIMYIVLESSQKSWPAFVKSADSIPYIAQVAKAIKHILPKYSNLQKEAEKSSQAYKDKILHR